MRMRSLVALSGVFGLIVQAAPVGAFTVIDNLNQIEEVTVIPGLIQPIIIPINSPQGNAPPAVPPLVQLPTTSSVVIPFDVTVGSGVLNALNASYIQKFAGAVADIPFYYQEPGTDFSRKKKELKDGVLAVDTGAGQSAGIHTPYGKVDIKSDSTCQIKVSPNSVEVAVIGGRTPVNFIADNGEKIAVLPGEAFKVEADPEEFIATQGDRNQKPIKGKIVFGRYRTEKRPFSARDYSQQRVTIAGVDLSFGFNHPTQKKRFHEHIKQVTGKEPAHTAQNKPVDVMGIIPLPIQSAYQPWLITKDSVLSGIETNLVKLTSGSLFGQAPSSLTVRTPLADVSTTKGTVLAIEIKEGACRIKVCAGTGTTHVISGKHKVSLMPGHEALITKSKPSDSDARPVDGIGRRSVKTYPMGNYGYATLGEFDTLAFLINSPYVQQLRGVNTKESKAVLEKMMKATAAISYVTTNKGQYYAEQ